MEQKVHLKSSPSPWPIRLVQLLAHTLWSYSLNRNGYDVRLQTICSHGVSSL
jgi:hypothetical protein